MFESPERFGVFEAALSTVRSGVILLWVCQSCGSAYSPALWRPLQITSRQCRPALCWLVYSPSWASLCLWLSSSPSAKERGSPSPASFRPSPVSSLSFRCLSCSLHFCPHWCPLPPPPQACASWLQPPSTQTASTWMRSRAGMATATSWRGSPSRWPSSPPSLTLCYARRRDEKDTSLSSNQPWKTPGWIYPLS